MSKRILIVEDEEAIAKMIAMNLRVANMQPVIFYDGSEAELSLGSDHNYDLALLDVMVPGKDGFELLESLKPYDIPVIFLTAKDDVASKVQGLTSGAEDYIVKPFEVVTLLVRIEKVLKRTGRLNQIYHFGNIKVDVENRIVTKDDAPVDIPPLEFDVLTVLIKNKNRTVSRDHILNEIWGEDYFGDLRTVDVRIANIRKKLGLGDMIRTISKVGYRLEEPKQ